MLKKRNLSENKIRRINLRLTEEEYDLIVQRSEQFAQKNISIYVRKHLLGKKMYVETYDTTGEKFNIAVSSYTDQIKRIGRSYNQAVRYLQAHRSPEDTKLLLNEIEKMTDTLLKNTASLSEIAKKALTHFETIKTQE